MEVFLQWLFLIFYMYFLGFIWMFLSFMTVYARHCICDKKMWKEFFKYSLCSWLGIWRLIEEHIKLSRKE